RLYAAISPDLLGPCPTSRVLCAGPRASDRPWPRARRRRRGHGASPPRAAPGCDRRHMDGPLGVAKIREGAVDLQRLQGRPARRDLLWVRAVANEPEQCCASAVEVAQGALCQEQVAIEHDPITRCRVGIDGTK